MAISRLRASYHPLEIEPGRYTRPKTPITERQCPCCNVVEDEHHFLPNCKIYDQDRNIMFSKISTKYENICEIESRNKFKFLLINDDPLVLNALGKFIVRRAGLLWSQQDFEWRRSVPLFKCLTVLEFSFILFHLCLLITFFIFIMNDVPIVTFWIFTYHKIWILSIMFCSIWSYWIIYFLACLEVSWRVVS